LGAARKKCAQSISEFEDSTEYSFETSVMRCDFVFMRKASKTEDGWRSPQPADFIRQWSNDSKANANSDQNETISAKDGRFHVSFLGNSAKLIAALLLGMAIIFVLEELRFSGYFHATVVPQTAQLEEVKKELDRAQSKLTEVTKLNTELNDRLRDEEYRSARRIREHLTPSWVNLRDALNDWQESFKTASEEGANIPRDLRSRSENLSTTKEETSKVIDSVLGTSQKR
jgi:hypothetical protein